MMLKALCLLAITLGYWQFGQCRYLGQPSYSHLAYSPYPDYGYGAPSYGAGGYPYQMPGYYPPGAFYDQRRGIMRPFPGGGMPIIVDYHKRCSGHYVGLKAHPEERQYYYVCKPDCVIFGRCQRFQQFNATSGQCVQYTPSEYEPTCKAIGRFSIYSDCHLYYKCDKSMQPQIYSCPHNMIFSQESGKCVPGNRCIPTQIVSDAENIPEYCENKYPPCLQNGVFRSPSDCSLYYTCALQDQRVYLQTRFKCPDDTFYDLHSNSCLPQSQVPCDCIRLAELVYPQAHLQPYTPYAAPAPHPMIHAGEFDMDSLEDNEHPIEKSAEDEEDGEEDSNSSGDDSNDSDNEQVEHSPAPENTEDTTKASSSDDQVGVTKQPTTDATEQNTTGDSNSESTQQTPEQTTTGESSSEPATQPPENSTEQAATVGSNDESEAPATTTPPNDMPQQDGTTSESMPSATNQPPNNTGEQAGASSDEPTTVAKEDPPTDGSSQQLPSSLDENDDSGQILGSDVTLDGGFVLSEDKSMDGGDDKKSVDSGKPEELTTTPDTNQTPEDGDQTEQLEETGTQKYELAEKGENEELDETVGTQSEPLPETTEATTSEHGTTAESTAETMEQQTMGNEPVTESEPPKEFPESLALELSTTESEEEITESSMSDPATTESASDTEPSTEDSKGLDQGPCDDIQTGTASEKHTTSHCPPEKHNDQIHNPESESEGETLTTPDASARESRSTVIDGPIDTTDTPTDTTSTLNTTTPTIQSTTPPATTTTGLQTNATPSVSTTSTKDPPTDGGSTQPLPLDADDDYFDDDYDHVEFLGSEVVLDPAIIQQTTKSTPEPQTTTTPPPESTTTPLTTSATTPEPPTTATPTASTTTPQRPSTTTPQAPETTNTPLSPSTTTPQPPSTTTPPPPSTTTLLLGSTSTPSPASTTTPETSSTTTPQQSSTTTPPPPSTTTLLPGSTSTPLPASTTTPLPASTTTPEPPSTTTPQPPSTSAPLPVSTTTPQPPSTTTPLPPSTTTPHPPETATTPLPPSTSTPPPASTTTQLPLSTTTPIIRTTTTTSPPSTTITFEPTTESEEWTNDFEHIEDDVPTQTQEQPIEGVFIPMSSVKQSAVDDTSHDTSTVSNTPESTTFSDTDSDDGDLLQFLPVPQKSPPLEETEDEFSGDFFSGDYGFDVEESTTAAPPSSSSVTTTETTVTSDRESTIAVSTNAPPTTKTGPESSDIDDSDIENVQEFSSVLSDDIDIEQNKSTSSSPGESSPIPTQNTATTVNTNQDTQEDTTQSIETTVKTAQTTPQPTTEDRQEDTQTDANTTPTPQPTPIPATATSDINKHNNFTLHFRHSPCPDKGDTTDQDTSLHISVSDLDITKPVINSNSNAIAKPPPCEPEKSSMPRLEIFVQRPMDVRFVICPPQCSKDHTHNYADDSNAVHLKWYPNKSNQTMLLETSNKIKTDV